MITSALRACRRAARPRPLGRHADRQRQRHPGRRRRASCCVSTALLDRRRRQGRCSCSPSGEARGRATDARIDGRRHDPVPGLIDAHGHVMGARLRRAAARPHRHELAAECSSGSTAYAAANPDARWIVGRGWNQELWPDKRFPTAADLDAVVADRPVWLEPVDGHAAGRQQRGDEGGRGHRRDHGPPAAGSSGPRPADRPVRRRAMALVEQGRPPPSPRNARPGAGQGAGDRCSATA